MARKAKVESRFRMIIMGHELTGERRAGRWTFTCPSWPEIAAECDADRTADRFMDLFMRRALEGVVTVKRPASR